MTAIPHPSDFDTIKPKAVPSARPRHRARAHVRAWQREFLKNWLGPLGVVMVLAGCFQLGLFTQTDGRFFDHVTVNQPGLPPQVVVIERDSEFEAQGTARFQSIERGLARLGVERVGYLGADRGRVTTPRLPVVIGLPTQALPENRSWELQIPAGGLGSATASARTLPASQYGINRTQVTQLPARTGSNAVFDAALAGDSSLPRGEFLVPMPDKQSIPILKAQQVVAGHMPDGALDGLVAMVVRPEALQGSLSTSISPDRRATSEAIFRAYAVNALRSESAIFAVQPWQAWALLLLLGAFLALVYRQADPKRLAVAMSLGCTIIAAGLGWAAIAFLDALAPISALMLAPWLVAFERVLQRETSQDRRLERTASHAVQTTFDRTALREGARLPQFLGTAAQYAGVERSLVVELLPNGKLELIAAHDASIDDIAVGPKELNIILRKVKESFSVRDASDIVPGWEGDARIGWVGTGKQQMFWLHTRPRTATPGKSAHLVRSIVSSFREVARWRADLNARSSPESRHLPIDNKVASAIALVANESEQIRRGFDSIDTAIVIFHLIGTPLHANSAMQKLYHEAGLSVFDSSLRDVLLSLSELEEAQVDAVIEDIMLNGTEMRMPMRDLGKSQRMLSISAPAKDRAGGNRILVLEAIDMRSVNRIANLRTAVAKFIDLQLRNDFEAILLGSQLASDERLGNEQIRSVVGEIDKTARRATGRLDEVAHLVRADTEEITEAWYPVDATAIVLDAISRTSIFAEELGVTIEAEHPSVSGFTIAEPVTLGEMIVAMLRVVTADTPAGGTVKLSLEEQEGRTHIRISGGFGIGFGRLLWLISSHEEGAVGEYKVIGEAIAKATRWSAGVSYWGSEASGFGFNIDLRGV